MREVLRLDTNVPIIAALKFNSGVTVQGRYGDQVMYTIETEAGERVLYVPPIVQTKIEQAGLRAGDWFRIAKVEVRNGLRRHIEWRVEPIPPEEQAPKVSEPEPAPQESAQSAQPQPTTTEPATPPEPTPSRPKTKLEDALKTVVAACHAATVYAREIGFAIPQFTSEDIAKMAMTLTIEGRNGGAR